MTEREKLQAQVEILDTALTAVRVDAVSVSFLKGHLEARISEMPVTELSPWREIESAPLGEPVDLWNEGFKGRVADFIIRNEGHKFGLKRRGYTHWMPVPAPPTKG